MVENEHDGTLSSPWSDLGHEQPTESDEGIHNRPHADERQIELDTDRSFVLYPVGEQVISARGGPPLMSPFRRDHE